MEQKQIFEQELECHSQLFHSGKVLTVFFPSGKPVSDAFAEMVAQYQVENSNVTDVTEKEELKQVFHSAIKELKSMKDKLLKGTVLLCRNSSVGCIVDILLPDEPITTLKISWGEFFDLDELRKELLERNAKYGFIIYDKFGIYYCETQGSKVINQKELNVQLPTEMTWTNKHNTVEQETTLRMQKYTGEIYEETGFKNVDGLFLAGSSNLKDYFKSLYFIPQLRIKLIKQFQVQYGFQQGFKEVIRKGGDYFPGYQRESTTCQEFEQQLYNDEGKVVRGTDKTIECIEDGKACQVFYSTGLKGFITFYSSKQSGKKLTKYTKFGDVPPTIIEQQGFEFKRVQEDDRWEVIICDWLMKKRMEKKFELKVISCDFGPGRQFLKGSSGLACTSKVNLAIEQEAPVEPLDI